MVQDISIAVPGLGVGGVDGGEAGGVGRRPAALNGILASEEVVIARNGVLILAGAGEVGGTGLSVGFAEGRVRRGGENRARRGGSQSGAAEPLGVAIVIEAAAGVDGSGLARKRNERFLQGLAAHESEF